MPDLYEQTNHLLNELTSLMSGGVRRPCESLVGGTTEVNNSKDDVVIDDEPPIDATNLLPAPETTPVGIELWEALAYDLALDHTPASQIADAYSISLAQLDHLSSNPYFSKMLKAKKEEIANFGSDAAFTVKMRMVANRATPQFMKRLTSPSTPTREFHALFKTAVELAKLLPINNEEQSTPVIGTAVTFNIQGVPGLEHLTKTISPASDPDVIDATFSEVSSKKEQLNYLQEL